VKVSGGLRGRLARLFAVVGVVTALLTVLVVGAFVQLQRATVDRVDVFGPALLSTETLYGAYSDQETGLRGFLLSEGREDFLEPYDRGRSSERTALADLRRLLRDEPEIIELVARVRAAAREWQLEVAMPAIRQTRTGPVSGSTFNDVERGRERFDAIRAALDDLRAPVRARRTAADGDLNDSQLRLEVVLAVALVGLLLIALVTWHALRSWVTEPLARLGAVTERVEGGELSRSIEVEEAPTEIAVLADQVDRMRMRVLEEYALAVGSRAEALEARALVEEQAEDLRRSNAELEQFAYVASHDLQEPLRMVASYTELLGQRYKGKLDDKADKYIHYAVDGAKRMQRLVADLLAYSRVGSQGKPMVPVDCNAVLSYVLTVLAEPIRQADAVVDVGSLPIVQGDEGQIGQLFQNLIGNALKFRGSDPPRIAVEARLHRGRWLFSVTDNGIGIDMQHADRIFEMFQRLHERGKYEGSGVGLAIAKRIVERHGGRIWLDSRPGEGTTFYFTLLSVARKATSA
jgi:signal transduction histidine kinase